jgi:hypothetical protein
VAAGLVVRVAKRPPPPAGQPAARAALAASDLEASQESKSDSLKRFDGGRVPDGQPRSNRFHGQKNGPGGDIQLPNAACSILTAAYVGRKQRAPDNEKEVVRVFQSMCRELSKVLDK